MIDYDWNKGRMEREMKETEVYPYMSTRKKKKRNSKIKKKKG